jgi:hypothetical protein
MAASRPSRRPATLLAPLLLALLIGHTAARAEDIPFGDTAVRSSSLADFRAELQRLQSLVAACSTNPTACDAKQVPTDEHVAERVDPGQPTAFELHWEWLRTALHTAQTAKPEDRARYMREAQAQLESMSRETAAPVTGESNATGESNFAATRAAANSVLNSPEFARNTGTTWWDRFVARIQNAIARLFNGVGNLGAAAPWIGRLLEWLLFLTAAVGLLVFLLRSAARQRMKLALGAAAPATSSWQREADDWAAQAHRHAAAAEWREAVHCLYWAAIVHLESRRAWRHNPTRTPREYVRLLKPGSPQQLGLRGLTQLFERQWYGQRATSAEDYDRAQACFRQLEAPSSETTAPTSAPAEATA